MKAKSLIQKILKAINGNKSEEIIKELVELLIDEIKEAAEEPLFYSLPFDQISLIIQKANYIDKEEISNPVQLLQTIIQKNK